MSARRRSSERKAQVSDAQRLAAQAGPVSANAPVRVASDGDDAGGSGSTAAAQSTSGSNGTAQVGQPTASASIRVLSDGDGSGAGASGGGGGDQTVTDSSGSAQIASPSASAPIRVVSEGDDVEDTVGVGAQGEPVAPVDEDSPDGGTGAQGGPVAVIESIPATAPATDILEDGSATSAELRPVSAVLGASAESLPLSGLGIGAMLLMGLALISTGAALRRGSVAAG